MENGIEEILKEHEALCSRVFHLLNTGNPQTKDIELIIPKVKELFGMLEAVNIQYINPLPKNTADVLRKYKKIVVAEQNLGQFAGYLRMKVPGLNISQFNQVKGQPFVTRELIDAFTKLLEE